jgi:hypothetical protein
MGTQSYDVSARVGRGGKVRSETVTVRLDPKLRYFADLAARKQRRTLSSFIEWAIEDSLTRVHLTEGGFNDTPTSIDDVIERLWDVDEPDRFVKLALRFPDLLTHNEQLLWKLIRENGLFWKGYYDKKHKWIFKTDDESTVSFRNLREHWDLINKIVRGEAPVSEMPKIAEIPGTRASSPMDVAPMDDEDIPF